MTFFFAGDTKAQGWPFTGDLSVATPGKDSWITGYYAVKKWLTPGLENPDYGALDDNDFVLLRYADVKLMYAEAKEKLNGFVPNPLFPAIKTQYADKYKFWSIPQTEIDRNQPALEQNPGY
ncbi:hypothetical protein J2T02_002492 [Chitinophaga terrae (ex Kim and Jung 2007)]|uniref:RagB/SusD family nutrient uptake outer membrane protein n=1 Tax=Chitinophaga terrae (ex Kim and Jung 2007) TaxID=408074 RepID=UPI00278861A7|nr:RagB/SusD family nutrient uptake outer membrane protein [Chitinophaga terrae (ex Kim and Jung 2007)]MDQ0107373.1 hypothetical protein [Chitinophaga terrae (ex Kim and Jung 2007)]